tara:strand:+ start:17885 stop:18133 length:249 start_codon:yes stop_codon:yes gene_type:complete
MMDNDIYTRLNGIFRDLFMRDDIFLKPGTTALDIEGWDSFRHIELMLATEIQFGIRFHSREIDEMRNIGDLVGFIEAHLQAG